jgi:transketolase
LNSEGIKAEVINIYTIKPLDAEIILNSVQKTGCIVTAEEHNYLGGMGESIAGMLSRNHPTPLEFVATQDCFGESGTPVQLMKKYGLNKSAIIQKVREVIKRK